MDYIKDILGIKDLDDIKGLLFCGTKFPQPLTVKK